MKFNFLATSIFSITLASGCSSNPYEQHNSKSVPLGKEYSIVKFDFDSYVVNKESEVIIQNAKSILAHYPDLSLTLEGRASVEGASSYNLKLSEKRTNSVKEILINNGVNQNRIATQYLGEEAPLESPILPSNQANRSVEITIKSKNN